MRYRSRFGNLKIPMKKSYTKEIEGSTVVVQGTRIEFENNIFETDNKDIIKFLDTDEVCKKMQERGVFIKVDESTLEAATKVETLEEKEARIKKELDEIKKQKAKDKVKPSEKGKGKSKVGNKDEKPKF